MDVALTSPYVVTLTGPDREKLQARLRAPTTAQRDVLRARIVLAAADGDANAQIARDLAVHLDTVRKWRRRYCAEGLDALRDRPRPGRGFDPVWWTPRKRGSSPWEDNVGSSLLSTRTRP